MPTITITSPELPARRRRAVAVRLTRWLTGRGVTATHAVVRFVTEEPGSLYAGAFPVEALPAPAAGAGGAEPLHHASVVCQIGVDRDAGFRDELAAEIAAALGVGPGTAFFYLDLQPTARGHVYVADHGALRRVDTLGDLPAPATEGALPRREETPA
ncbi:hypothetical protein [Streptomyces sp. 8K308]|uniref:hypothetical protein n=1 Tax=Streptomyces sp. 8K308 TaxID=2530388 RepID=UPI001A9FD57A|nr:hypothetical protein [Streptomyces sp. 8K308]